MRIFFYKFIIIIVGLFILYQLTIGYTIKKIQQKFYSINVKEQSEFIKDKLREEIKNTLKKDEILTKEDAILIKKFYLKIKLMNIYLRLLLNVILQILLEQIECLFWLICGHFVPRTMHRHKCKSGFFAEWCIERGDITRGLSINRPCVPQTIH